MRREDKPGFIVTDMADVDRFEPIAQAEPPDPALYALTGLSRGDDMAGRGRHPQRSEGRLVLGRKPAHMAGLCLSSP
ncbi:MAG: DUF5701 family protein, partial [Actinomycetes bacterium]